MVLLALAAAALELSQDQLHTECASANSASALFDGRYPHTGRLAELAWQYRESLSFYDALYVALAVRLDVPLLSADVRLVNAGHYPVELV